MIFGITYAKAVTHLIHKWTVRVCVIMHGSWHDHQYVHIVYALHVSCMWGHSIFIHVCACSQQIWVHVNITMFTWYFCMY